MSSNTPRLLLKRNDGADPFLRQDFVDNWNKLDAAPGTHVCTSTSRPSTWNAAMAGREIVETDTYRRLVWSGSGWLEPRVAPGTATATISPGVALNKGVTTDYTLWTIPVLRPCRISTITVFRLATKPYLYQQAFCDVLIGDVIRTVGTTGAASWADQQTTATQYDDKPFIVFGEAVVKPGANVLKARVRVGTASTNVVYVGSITSFMISGQGTFGASVYL